MASAAVRRVEQDVPANLDTNEQDQMRPAHYVHRLMIEPPASAR
jgi:hypothetical protein